MKLIDINQLAEAIGCSTKSIRRKVQAGIIPVIQLGGKGSLLRFNLQAVLESFQHHAEKVSSETANPPPNLGQKLSGPTPKWRTSKRNPKRKG